MMRAVVYHHLTQPSGVVQTSICLAFAQALKSIRNMKSLAPELSEDSSSMTVRRALLCGLRQNGSLTESIQIDAPEAFS